MKEMTLEDRYKTLIEARNFHYDNFNKWMTYFYVAIGALFVGYCTIISSDKSLPQVEYLLSILGFIVSLLWYWSAKGYYYWNINFINLINYYEETLLKFDEKERVYFVFANKETQNNYFSPLSGANISSSKIAILFSFIISTVWGFIVINKLFSDYSYNCCCFSTLLQVIISLASVLILSYLIPVGFLKSDNKRFYDLKL